MELTLQAAHCCCKEGNNIQQEPRTFRKNNAEEHTRRQRLPQGAYTLQVAHAGEEGKKARIHTFFSRGVVPITPHRPVAMFAPGLGMYVRLTVCLRVCIEVSLHEQVNRDLGLPPAHHENGGGAQKHVDFGAQRAFCEC